MTALERGTEQRRIRRSEPPVGALEDYLLAMRLEAPGEVVRGLGPKRRPEPFVRALMGGEALSDGLVLRLPRAARTGGHRR